MSVYKKKTRSRKINLFKKIVFIVWPLIILAVVIVIIYLFSIFKSHDDWIRLGTLLVTIGILITAIWAGKLAIKSLDAAEKVKTYQFLTDMISNYSSAEMLLAVQILWDLYKKMAERLGYDPKKDLNCFEKSKLDDALWDEYFKIYEQDKGKIDYQKELVKSAAQKETTLHHYRRIVGRFYELLAGIHEENVIPEDTIFRYWNKDNLSIIPKIILPIEKSLFKYLYPRSKGEPEIFDLMEKLYNDCPENVNRKSVSPQD